MSFSLGGIQTRRYHLPLVHTVLRAEFDQLLLQAAEDAGASVYQGTAVRGIEFGGAGTTVVHADNQHLTADCLVGADGANSIVRTLLNARESYFWQAAVYCEIPWRLVNERVIEQGRMLIDWGTLPCGYAWAFPKNGTLNVGAGGPLKVAKHARSYATRFLETFNILKKGAGNEVRLWVTNCRR